MWRANVIQSRRQSSRCLVRQRGTRTRSNVREKRFGTQIRGTASKALAFPPKFPRKRLPEIFNQAAYAQHFSRMRRKKRTKEKSNAHHVRWWLGRRKEKQKWRNERERSIVVKLRRKHRSRRNNTMFYARRLTFYSETALLETTMLQIKKIVIFRCKRKGKCFCV